MKKLILMAAMTVATIAQAAEPGDTVTVSKAQQVTSSATTRSSTWM